MKSNLKPNKIIGALTLSLTVIGTPAFSAGIPTIDATAITQAIMTLEQLHREYEQLVKTYENQVKHFNAVTGIRDINRFINYGNKFTEFLPDNLKTSIQSLGKYGRKRHDARGALFVQQIRYGRSVQQIHHPIPGNLLRESRN